MQLSALNDVLAAARAIPFYGERLEQAGIGPGGLRSLADLSALPPLERGELQRLGVAGLSRRRGLGLRRSTSGSTGRPVQVLWPLELMRWVDAIERRSKEWLGVRLGEPHLFVRTLAPGSPRINTLGVRNGRRLEPSALDDPRSREAALTSLARHPPVFVAGNAKSLYVFALALLEEGRKLSPRVVVSSGSRLLEHHRETIERAFACPVYERYGTIEIGLVAHPCREAAQQHVPAESLLLEIARDDGTPAEAGESGHVLLTSLRNQAMPLVRYRIGDLASVAQDPCPCGRSLPVLQQLVGRSNDLLVTAEGRLLPPEVVSRQLMALAGASLLEFEIVQREDRRIDVLVVQRDDPDPGLCRTQIAELMDELVGQSGATSVERVADIPAGPGGKMRHIRSLVAPREARTG